MAEQKIREVKEWTLNTLTADEMKWYILNVVDYNKQAEKYKEKIEKGEALAIANVDKKNNEDLKKLVPVDLDSTKAWFVYVGTDMRKKKVAVPDIGADGKVKKIKAKHKDGTYKKDENGNFIMIDKKKYIEVEDSVESAVFNLLKAKKAFCNEFMPNLLPKKAEKKESIYDKLEGWF